MSTWILQPIGHKDNPRQHPRIVDERGGIVAEVQYHDDAVLIAATLDAIESLDNLSAAFETMLAHYGAKMPEGDRQCREKLLSQARAAIAKATKGA